MGKKGNWVSLFICFFILVGVKPVMAEQLSVAVAANFTAAVKVIAGEFEKQTSHSVMLSFSSTGKHYAQIKNGAPFALFLAADTRRPMLLEKEKIAVPGSRYTYAQGRIVLWSPKPGFVDGEGKVLGSGDLDYLAIANPKLAPYGKAAQEVLETKALWTVLQDRIVRGENISQTFQYVDSGNADAGFIAYSQIRQPGRKIKGGYWLVPQNLYSPIEQQVVMLKDTAASRQFWTFLKSDPAKRIIKGFGYGIPR